MELYKKLGFLEREKWNFPLIVNLNVFRGECPCKCVHCPVGQVEFSKRAKRFLKGELPISLYKKVVDEMAAINSKGVLRIHSVGEPLLWENLIQAVHYSKINKVQTWIFTSAITRDTSLLEELCKNIDIIEISVNSIEREDYLQTKGIDGFELVKSNILYMLEYIKSNHLLTRLICSRVQTNDKSQDENFVSYWKSIDGISDVFVRSFHNYNGLLNSDHDKQHMNNQACLVHWARFNIDVNGDAVVCFNELFKESIGEEIILGNVNNESIENIWKSDKLNSIRLFQLNKGKLNIKLPCSECTTCQKYPPHENTSEKQIKSLNKG